jgi:hypothetical protein
MTKRDRAAVEAAAGGAVTGGGLDQLRTELRYHRERRDLYRAKAYGPRPTNAARLRELERAYELAEARLRRAESAAVRTEQRP